MSHPMPIVPQRLARFVESARGCLAAALLLALLALAPLFAATEAEARRWGSDYLPNVPVVTQEGKTLAFYDDVIKGKIVVISFLYTSCRDVCPLTSARLAQVQERLGDKFGRDVFFVSVSIDPETDTPALLKAQADALRARPGWLFLTGKREDIDAIRYKLGERSRSLTEHRNEVLFGNDKTGEWARESVFGDLERFEHSLRQMDTSLKDDARDQSMSATKGAGINAIISGTPGEGLFHKACAPCHTVGKGDSVGPDLHGVTERRDTAWLKKFITDPERMRTQRDPIALELMAARPGLRMPNIGLSAVDTEDLLVFLAKASAAVPKPLEPVAGAPPAPDTVSPLKSLAGLTTHEGKTLQQGDLDGHAVGVVFGFTHCPDVCPTTLLDWSNMLATLGPDAGKLKLFFVSVDSERDTPEALKTYMQAFDPRITALTGSADAIAKVAQAFDAHYEKVETGSDYVYDHTIKTFMFDAHGKRAGGVDLNTATIDRRALLGRLLN